MSSDFIISVEHLSKKYRLGQIGATTLRESAERLWHKLRGRNPDEHMGEISSSVAHLGNQAESSGNESDTELWALRDVSFEVKRGEVLGIIGKNGAGKSTLLKILSRITEPTSGRAILRGRVGSLLEVGTGFHPELSGRENIYLNGAILGMKRAEISKKFDEIVDFAEVEKFIDTPVKRYSSGMYVRLAFAVAAHLDPEILLVDEVLAVGDVAFQKKCLGKMGDVAREGRTVLFVSHNMGAISRLCEKSLLLSTCKKIQLGETNEIINQYVSLNSSVRGIYKWSDGYSKPGVYEFRLFSLIIKNSQGAITSCLDFGEKITVELEYELLKQLAYCRIGIRLSTISGIDVFTAYDSDNDLYLGSRQSGRFITTCEIPSHLLSPGRFVLSIGAGIPMVKNFVSLNDVAIFDIVGVNNVELYDGGKRRGVITPQLEWSIKSLNED